MNDINIENLKGIANQLRIRSIAATTAAGSGHPTSCCSAADLVAALFFGHMRFDPKNPHYHNNDRFILSKGHAAPLLYAAWAETGLFPSDELLKLRRIDSDLEGHPTPRLPFVDVATGSLGQGLSAGVGMAFDAQQLRHSGQRAGIHKLSNLCATIDINRLGQSQPTMLQHDLEAYRRRWEAFGWQALPVDGHDIPALLAAYQQASDTHDRPTVVLARTLKGKGLGAIENDEHWHGKALDGETANKVIAEL